MNMLIRLHGESAHRGMPAKRKPYQRYSYMSSRDTRERNSKLARINNVNQNMSRTSSGGEKRAPLSLCGALFSPPDEVRDIFWLTLFILASFEFLSRELLYEYRWYGLLFPGIPRWALSPCRRINIFNSPACAFNRAANFIKVGISPSLAYNSW